MSALLLRVDLREEELFDDSGGGDEEVGVVSDRLSGGGLLRVKLS